MFFTSFPVLREVCTRTFAKSQKFLKHRENAALHAAFHEGDSSGFDFMVIVYFINQVHCTKQLLYIQTKILTLFSKKEVLIEKGVAWLLNFLTF